jgi:hypothetical protein
MSFERPLTIEDDDEEIIHVSEDESDLIDYGKHYA